jgi:hypothetical protein
MPQPPTTPFLAHENVRFLPSLTQKVFNNQAAGAAATFVWEFDLAARITDAAQFFSGLITPVAPSNSSTTAGGGAGPQVTPQPAIGPFLDAFVFTSGAGGGSLLVEYAVDANPCLYRSVSNTVVAASTGTNLSGLRVTGRFVRLTFTNVTAASVIEVGYYIRNT